MITTIKGLFQSYIKKAKSSGNTDIQLVLEEMLSKIKLMQPQETPIELEIISGWKGIGSTEIYKGFNNDFICVQHIKDKDTGEIDEVRIEIKKEDVNKMVDIVSKLELNKKYKCYYIAKELGWANWKDLWRERKIYFRTYYFPIKILEKLKVINYGGRGTVIRLI